MRILFVQPNPIATKEEEKKKDGILPMADLVLLLDIMRIRMYYDGVKD